MADFDAVWDRIRRCVGQTFTTAERQTAAHLFG